MRQLVVAGAPVVAGGHAAAASSVASFTCSTASIGSCRKRRPIARNASTSPVVRKRYVPSRRRVVLDPLPRQRLRHLAGGLVGREDERHVAAEDALQDRPDQRVVRAAEDDRVDAGGLQRRRVLAYRRCCLLGKRIVALDQRHEPRAHDRDHGHAGVERVHERLVAAARDGRLRREQADPAVARRLHGRVRLRRDHADDRHAQLRLQLRQRGRRRRVAGDDDELDALRLEEGADLAREAAHLRERTRPVRQPGAVAEIDEVLVRQGDEALVQHRQAADARVEHSDRPLVHARDCRAARSR